MNKNAFFKNVHFYLISIASVLALVAVLFYGLNCASEFNGGVVSSAVVTMDIIAVIAGLVSVCLEIVGSFTSKDSIVGIVASYARVFKYVAFVCLLGAFFQQILAEYSLIGTILYPIVSGTVGDPVDSTLSFSYFASLIFTFIAFITAMVAGIMDKSKSYKAEKAN